ncbi:MAG: hydroxymyristoyl-ACP dehydratase [Bacteroidales bacterium]|nr:hydroxymyristoyl-ACP dehydratase [Bacteroidales bacterium]
MSFNDENSKPLAAGTEIYKLIPQRPPIVMVDALYEVSETGAVTGLTVLPDNIFVDRGLLTESGIIEHVAQSAAVFNGYWAVVRGIEPSLGYIAEIKRFRILSLPPVGSHLRTDLEVLNDFGGMMLLSSTVYCVSETIAQGQMKLFIDLKG